MSFDTRRLAVLRAVIERGSFTQAADDLALSQPAVSRQLAALERELGVELVGRGPGPVVPTPAGRALLEDAESILPAIDAARRRLAELADGEGGSVRLGAIPSAMASIVPAAVAALREERPRVEVELEEGWSGGLVRRVARGDLDLAVVATGADDEEVLTDEPYSLLVEAGGRLARRRRLALADLADEPWILAPDPGGRDAMLDACRDAGFVPRRVAAAGWDAAAELVAIGLGVALAPRGIAAGLAARPGVVAREPADAPRRRLHLLAAPRRRRGAAEIDLERCLREAALSGASGAGRGAASGRGR